MRLLVPAIAVAALCASGCAIQKTYTTQLDVCSSGNGTVKSATITRSSGDGELDKHALEQVGAKMVYEPSKQTMCRPLTVEYHVYGEQDSKT